MKLRVVLFAFALIFGLQTSWATTTPAATNGIEPIVADDYTSTTAADADFNKVVKKDKKGLGKIFSWVKKKVTKVLKKFGLIGGFDDPVDKWFWFWIISWGLAILISIIAAVAVTGAIWSGSFGIWAIFSLISYLLWLFGGVSLVVWLIKKFS